MDDEGFEPSTFRMQNGRSTTELNALPGHKSMDTEGFEPSTSRMRNGRSSTELSALRFTTNHATNASGDA